MKAQSETMNKLGQRLGLGENKGYAIAIALALIFVSVLIAGYYLATRPPPEGYSTIYMLDSQRGMDYPELLVIGENNTFNVWVTVENHMRKSQSFEVLLKVTDETDPEFPVNADAKNSYAMTLEDEETWETRSTITIDKPGNYSVVFELWLDDGQAGELRFTGNVCVLNLEAATVLSNETNEEITAFSAASNWSPNGLLVEWPFNVTILNMGINDVGGVALVVRMLTDDGELGSYTRQLDTLVSGEEREISWVISRGLSQEVNPTWTTCTATLMLDNTVLDERELTQ